MTDTTATTSLTTLQTYALAKLISADQEKALKANLNLPLGVTVIPPFTVEISGTLSKGRSSEVAATNSVLSIKAMAYAMRRMGVQKDSFLNFLREAYMSQLTGGSDAADILAQKEIAECERELKEMIGTLPKRAQEGSVYSGLVVTQVITGPVGV